MSSIPLYGHTPIPLSINKHLHCFQVCVLMNKTAINILVKSLQGQILFLVGKHLGVQFLGHTASVYLTLKEIKKVFCEVVAPSYILLKNR